MEVCGIFIFQSVKLRFGGVLGGWIFTLMIVFIVTSYEPLALSLERISVFDANAPPQPSAAHPTENRLTTICASLRFLQIVFAATPMGDILLPPLGEVPRSGQGGVFAAKRLYSSRLKTHCSRLVTLTVSRQIRLHQQRGRLKYPGHSRSIPI